MKGTLFSALLGLVLVAGCSSPPPSRSLYTHREPFAGPDMDITLDNLLESSEDRSYLLWLNAVRIREGEWDARYYLEARYEGASDAGFLQIGPGETLIVAVDGETFRFRGPGSIENRNQTSRGTFVENAIYEASPDVLRKIAKAKDVKVQVNGDARKLYREFKPENIQRFRSFVLTYLGY